jgi:hypothetical protein
MSHDHFLDSDGFNLSAGESLVYGNHPKIDSTEGQERPSKLADDRTNC